MDIVNNEADQRYEAWIEDQRAGVIQYTVDGGVITYLHTIVGDEFGGRGVGSALAARALGDARSSDLRIVPRCPFVASYIAKHPEYTDIVVAP